MICEIDGLVKGTCSLGCWCRCCFGHSFGGFGLVYKLLHVFDYLRSMLVHVFSFRRL